MGLFSNKSKSSSSSEPWMPFSNYLRGKSGANNKGLPSDAYDLYRQGGWQPQYQGMQDQYTNYLSSTRDRLRPFDGAGDYMLGMGKNIADGEFDSNFNPVDYINMNNQRAGMGGLDPTDAMIRLLSGRPDLTYLDQQAGALTNNLTRNTNENVMPGLRSSAAISGQYGGSRQGIAEGLAASRLNQDIAAPVAQMYGDALERAQNRMQQMSQYLNDQAYNTAFGNANLGLNNNSQLMQRNNQNLAGRMQGINATQSGLNMQSSLSDLYGKNYGNYFDAMMMPNNMNWQNMNNYTGVMYPGAQLGGSTKSKSSQSTGIGNMVAGLGLGAAGIASGFGGWGKMFGGG